MNNKNTDIEATLSQELSNDKINKTQLRRDIESINSTDYSIYKTTNSTPQSQQSLINRGCTEGKVFNQVRAGYIFHCSVYKVINLSTAEHFNITVEDIKNYQANIANANNHILEFKGTVLDTFKKEANQEVMEAYEAVAVSKRGSVLKQLKEAKHIPTITLLEDCNKIVSINKFQEYSNSANIAEQERLQGIIAMRKEDNDLIVSYKATDNVNNERVLKSYFPSKWLVFEVLNLLCDIKNRGTLTKAEIKAQNKAAKEVVYNTVIDLYKSGVKQAEIAKTVMVSLKTVKRYVAKYKAS